MMTTATLPPAAGNLPITAEPKMAEESAKFLPLEPTTFEATGLKSDELEALVLKLLLQWGPNSGREIAEQVKISFRVMEGLLFDLKAQLLLTHKASAAMSDYVYELSDAGEERARRYYEKCTYFGAAPVPLQDYVASIEAQSIRYLHPKLSALCRAFSDLMLSPTLISQLGQAMQSGRGLLLFGSPGNGKTSIAERISRALGETIWIPRTISVGGEIIRLFDASTHMVAKEEPGSSLLDGPRVDRRWIRIQRPTIIAGGELTLDHLELKWNSQTGINEAPLQLKSNGGTLVIDDFGRQRVSVEELLNRWIIPLEKRIDYLNLPSGRQVQVPFDQLLVFSTNLEPRELVDEAFLRRIPYKIEVPDPSEQDFQELFKKIAAQLGFGPSEAAFQHLLEKHYRGENRALRCCHARDLLLQVKHFCDFHERPLELTPQNLDVAVKNYFGVL